MQTQALTPGQPAPQWGMPSSCFTMRKPSWGRLGKWLQATLTLSEGGGPSQNPSTQLGCTVFLLTPGMTSQSLGSRWPSTSMVLGRTEETLNLISYAHGACLASQPHD